MSLKVTNKQFIPFLILFMLLLGNFGGFSIAHSQSASDIQIMAIPENPNPGEQVDLSLNSYALNIDTSKTEWIVNGKIVLSGIGKKYYSITAPTAGGETNVTVRVYTGVTSLENSITIKPTTTVVLWQAEDSYVPPFYKGKALPAPDTKIRIIALPEIKVGSAFLNPKNMTYSWRKDFSNDQDASGYGKNYFEYISDYLDKSNYIQVGVVTTDQKYSVSSDVYVETFKPKLVFYKNDPNLGNVFERELEDGHIIKDQEILVAAPYFISPKELFNPRLTWTWGINGKPVETSSIFKYLLPLKVQDGVSGKSNIQLEIDNMDKVFQTAKKTILVEF